MVVIPRPYCSPDPGGPHYEQYCKQKLMLHQPFRRLEDLLGGCDTHEAAFAIFLQSGNGPTSLAKDMHRLETAQRDRQKNDDDEVITVLLVIYDVIGERARHSGLFNQESRYILCHSMYVCHICPYNP